MVRTTILCAISSDPMTENARRKVLVKRPRKTAAGAGVRPGRVGPAQSEELELVSTQVLKTILSSRNLADREAIEIAADTAAEGVLARDPGNGQFEIIEDDDLQAIIDNVQGLPTLTRPADATVEPLRDYVDDDHIALVSTKALRKVLNDDDAGDSEPAVPETNPGDFNPYVRD